MMRPRVAYILDLRHRAYALLVDDVPVTLETARAGQVEARQAGDDGALAMWSRLRVRALRAAGMVECSDGWCSSPEVLAEWEAEGKRGVA